MNPIRLLTVGAISSGLLLTVSAQAMPSTTQEAALALRLIEGMAVRGEAPVADLRRVSQELDRSFPQARAQASTMGNLGCVTSQLMQVRRFVALRGVRVRPMAPPSDGYYVSDTLPIRVYWQRGDEDMARQVLAAAEKAWQVQVGQTGYPQPYTDGDEGNVIPGMWYYVGNTGMGGGAYTEPLADVPMTAVSDCSSRIVFDRANESEIIASITAHEFNHATQFATDCAEADSAWENFASAVQEITEPAGTIFPMYFLKEFQQWPQFSLDFFASTSVPEQPSNFYQYGAGLYPIFLYERYGAKQLSYLKDAWMSFAQNGTVTISPWGITNSQGNKPDWFEGMDTFLQKHRTSFDDAFSEFADWRSIVGSYDDGHHFEKGANYPEVALADEHVLNSLPITRAYDVREYGSRHILLTVSAATPKLKVTVDGHAAATWAASVLVWKAAGAVDVNKLSFTGAQGSVNLEPLAAGTKAMLVVKHFKDASHDPDMKEYRTRRNFTYGIEEDVGGAGGAGGGAGAGGDAGAGGGAGAGGDAGAGGGAGAGGEGGAGGDAGAGGGAGAGGMAGAGGAAAAGGGAGAGGKAGAGGTMADAAADADVMNVQEGGGCDCSTSTTNPNGLFGVLGLALAALVRRRRRGA